MVFSICLQNTKNPEICAVNRNTYKDTIVLLLLMVLTEITKNLDRVETGIPGLDELIEGGFPKPAVIHVSGEAGTGKSTFVLQSLFYGARKNEVGLYITGVSEPVFATKKFMSRFSFYDETLIEKGIIVFEDLGASVKTDRPERALGLVETVIKKINPARIVIDPLPPPYLFVSITDYRLYLYGLFKALKQLNTLALVTTERIPGEKISIEDYMADAVITLSLSSIDNPLTFNTFIQVKKMRGTKHTKDCLSLDMSEEGLKVYKISRIG